MESTRGLKDYNPLRFFSFVGLMAFFAGSGLGTIPISDFIHTGKVTHPSTAVLSAGLLLIALFSVATGFILDALNRRYREQYLLLSDRIISLRNKTDG